MSYELQQFVPVGILFIMAAVFALANIALPSLIGKKRTFGAIKDTPYECGVPPAGDTHSRFSVKFYLVAMLFILFDLEVVFVVGWATVYRDLIRPVSAGGVGPVAFFAMLLFVGVLEVGHFYVWKQGALTWAPRPGHPAAPAPAPSSAGAAS
jgi:NADH-quinone oxidoreductase subunit A